MSEKQVVSRHGSLMVYQDLLVATLPLLAMAVFLYGPRPALLWLAAVVTANLCDQLVAFLRHRPFDPLEFSNESFGAMLVLLLPASVSYYVVIVSVAVAVLVGKEAFGGLGCYPFHPTAVGYAVAAVSWPEQVFSFPQPGTWLPLVNAGSAGLIQSASYTLKNGGTPRIDTLNLMLGNYAGPMGATAVVILVACALLLAVRRRTALPGDLLRHCLAVPPHGPGWPGPALGGGPGSAGLGGVRAVQRHHSVHRHFHAERPGHFAPPSGGPGGLRADAGRGVHAVPLLRQLRNGRVLRHDSGGQLCLRV